MPPPAPSRSRMRARGPWVASALLAAALTALPIAVLRRIADPSPWLHLKVGRFLLDGQHFGLPDPWAPYASRVYVPTQWLPSVATAELYAHWGNAVIVWERAAGITVLALLLLVWSASIARTWVAALATGLAVFAAWPGLTERPQLAGFVLLVPVLAAWWRTGQDQRPRWFLVPLTWVAAATHGVWATGLALGALVTLCLAVSGRLGRGAGLRLMALLGGCAAAAACTPVGPRLLLTPFAVSAQGRQFVTEWLPSSVRSPHVMAALALLGVAWVCLIVLRERPALWQAGLLVAGFGMALAMQRTVAVAAFVGVPLACTYVERLLTSRATGLAGLGREVRPAWRLWAAAAMVGLVVAVPLAPGRGGQPADVPGRLLTELRAIPAGTHIVATGDITGWLLFAAPQLVPVEDLRIESYSSAHITRFISAMAAEPGWDGFIRETRAAIALLPSDSPLLAALSEQSGWTRVGSDAGLVLLEAPR